MTAALQTFGAVGQRVAALGALTLLAAASMIPPHAPLALRAIPAVLAIVWAAAALTRQGPGAAVAVLVAALTCIATAGIVWQVAMPAAVAALFLASRAWPSLGTVREPLGRSAPWGTLLCAVVTPFALIGWVMLLRPDFSNVMSGLAKLDRRVLVLGAIGFVILNACCEEWIWRGIIQRRLTALFPANFAIGAQALSFGIAHAHGIPSGLVGVTLAGIWALMLGTLRRYSAGLLAPTLAHMVADATIAVIVILGIH